MEAKQFTILIIDDNPDDRMMIRRYLQKDSLFKYSVLEAPTLREGQEHLDARHPDCVLLDYLLPDGTGLDFLRSQGEVNPAQRSAIVMFTGHGSETIAAQSIRLGVMDYLIKSSLSQEIVRVSIQNAITKHSLFTQLHNKSLELQQANQQLEEHMQRHANHLDRLNNHLQEAEFRLRERETELALHKAEQLALESHPACLVAHLDAEYRLTHLGPSIEILTGQEASQWLSSGASFLDLIAEDDRTHTRDRLAAAHQTTQTQRFRAHLHPATTLQLNGHMPHDLEKLDTSLLWQVVPQAGTDNPACASVVMGISPLVAGQLAESPPPTGQPDGHLDETSPHTDTHTESPAS